GDGNRIGRPNMTGRPSVTGPATGLYVHIPFCLTRCGYCDFNTYAGLDHLMGGYVQALLREADLAAPAWADASFVSIFLGGGTPTMLPAGTMRSVLERLRESFNVPDRAEVTSEANPDTVDQAYLASIREAGVTRVSIGVQSFDPVVLRSLERLHSAHSARQAYRAARGAGFHDVNL